MDPVAMPLPCTVDAPSAADARPKRQKATRKSPYRRAPGRPPAHGAAMLTATLRGVNLRRIDGRSQVGVMLRRVRLDLLDHLGGEENATAPERILCDEVAKLRVITSAIGAWLLEQDSLVRDGELIPAVEAHARMVNALAKTLKQLGMRRAAREVDVAEQLQALHATRESSSTTRR
jgi:hypothetical protein